ncbi:MAG TPA: O-acetylhomoserine aminocarboxypropyltransferase/cysteine synthase [Candidatus Binataceae bacterium]|nr:O-acetylhomoserine aminocarboxypropyltransferase/cysteine synthase [Candidatus Binataceae bacterium]
MSDSNPTYKLATQALHAGQVPDPTTTARAVPIYATTSYVFHDTAHAANLFGLREFGNIYTRLMNPTNDVLEKRLAALDGGAAGLAFASGQAAITASLLTITHAGQNLISANSLYGGTWTLFTQTFAKLGIEVRFFDPKRPEDLSKLVDKNTRAVYIETPGNPKNDVPDYRKITDLAHSHGLPAIIDNTALTAALFRPIEHGFDIVVYSTTKFIGGHGVHVGGAIVDSAKFPWAKDPKKWPEFTAPDPAYHGMIFEEALRPVGNIAYILHIRTHWLRDTGACQSPFGSFLTLLGLETLHLRMERHSRNALAVAEFLEKHPAVQWVNYPGLPGHPDHANAKKYLPDGQGAIIGFGIKGGKEAGVKLINNVKLFSHLANIGDAKSLIIHPATTTHSQLTEQEQAQTGVTPEFVRLSVGIEDVRDIIADLDQALKASQG